MNRLVFSYFSFNLFLYDFTDWPVLAACLLALAFAVLGLYQLISSRSLKRVDIDILRPAIFYLAIIGCYIIFENVIINYRPVQIKEKLQASYPSSHTMSVVRSIMVTSILQFHYRIKIKPLLWMLDSFSALIVAITVIGRLISDVHWFTDIIGGLI